MGNFWHKLMNLFRPEPVVRYLPVPSRSGPPMDADTGQPELWVRNSGWLTGQNVHLIPIHPSWYYSGQTLHTTPAGNPPVGVIWHYTATDGGAENMAQRRLGEKKPKDRAASWHVTIDRDGKIYQMVPFNRGAWHCGRGKKYKGLGVEKATSPNRCLVGVELVGHGDSYTPEQAGAAKRVLKALKHRYGWKREQCVHEHRDFDPTRRSDCGPPWTDVHMPEILGSVGRFRSDEG